MLNPIFWKKVQGQKYPGSWGIVEHQIPSTWLPSVTEFQYFVTEITLLLLKFSWNFGQITEICLNFSVVSAQKYWTLSIIMQKYWN